MARPDVQVAAGDGRSFETSRTSIMGDFTLQTFSPQGVAPLSLSFGQCFCCRRICQRVIAVFWCACKDEVVDVQANQTNRIALMPTSNT